jgi:cytoskeletal protein CcmA (bactofilin family)
MAKNRLKNKERQQCIDNPLYRGYILYMSKIKSDLLEGEEFSSVIAGDAELSGIYSFEEPLLIQGKVSGELTSKTLVAVDTGGSVEGKIKASNVQILGLAEGEITASKKVVVSAKGTVIGNITAPEIYMEPGCIFDGRCFMK